MIFTPEFTHFDNRGQFPFPRSSAQRYVGFAVFGPDWLPKDEFHSHTEFLAEVEKQGYLVARYTSLLYGNLVRVPLSPWEVFDIPVVWHPLVIGKPVYQLDDASLSEILDKLQRFLDVFLAAMDTENGTEGKAFKWDAVDAFFAGIQRYNAELPSSVDSRLRPVLVDILVVDIPPALILEAPPDRILRHWGAQTSRTQLWATYKRFHIRFVEKLIERYGQGYAYQNNRARVPVAVAIEMINEPDYTWLPDEAQFEKAINPDAYPCDKYLSQLHLAQIPENDLPNKGCSYQFGYYQEQEFGGAEVRTPLRNFRWGTKFEAYVAAFAELHAEATMAAHRTIQRGGAQMRVIAAAVTHVNIDWLARMYRANSKTFRAVDAVAIHPYHWPQHDIHNMQFVAPLLPGDGMSATPREYARDYCKRFDFLQQLALVVTQPTQQLSYGLANKPIWITEFGIQTKKLGKFNDSLRDHPRMFVYERGASIPEGVQAIVWEDRWDAFLDQVSASYLRQQQVQTFIVYALRESTRGQTNDDDHSNYALFRADWSPRIAPETLNRIAALFLSFRDGE
ncbi:MAG: hypothetical protein AB7G75_19465 [Candidatus Binatia bacterium]